MIEFAFDIWILNFNEFIRFLIKFSHLIRFVITWLFDIFDVWINYWVQMFQVKVQFWFGGSNSFYQSFFSMISYHFMRKTWSLSIYKKLIILWESLSIYKKVPNRVVIKTVESSIQWIISSLSKYPQKHLSRYPTMDDWKSKHRLWTI